ncbi:cytochrome P450 2K6-like [Protobothrops mucrosquamatus]|uniref:cytochrome P450 2K6-like n=1 Tax=Protobothrops mucrosquamatus TaxID=103944 RepID=UPI0010FB37E1|nr:cytochrome P450 2K6-like [Protobothrops mucrosquamatus]
MEYGMYFPQQGGQSQAYGYRVKYPCYLERPYVFGTQLPAGYLQSDIFCRQSKEDPNSTYDEDNLVHCIGDIFIAGTDITSSVLQWALLLMATHPDIQDKVYKEIETVLDPSHSICYGDRKNLPYINAVIHEIIRSKYVTLFGLPRKCVKDVYLNGFLIPKGAMILPDLRSVLLDPEQWETPEKFNPNHFLDKEGHFVTKEAFMPFGAGARSCLGELFARIQVFIMFTSLLRAFRLQPPEGVEKLSEEPNAIEGEND